VISAVPPILYGLSQSFHQGVLVAAVYIIVNQIEGNLALPLIMGRQVSLHPAVVAIGVLIAGAVFGALGLILSVPLIALTLILIDEVWVKPQARRRAAGQTGAATREHAAATREHAVYGAIALAAVLVVAGLLVQQIVTLLLAVMFTVIVSLPLDACATALRRRGIPRGIGALIGLFAGLAVVAGIIVFLVPTISSQIADLVNGAPGIVNAVEVKIAHAIGVRPGDVAAKIQHGVATFVRQPSHLIGPIATISISIATVIGGIVIGVMTAYYMAVQPEPLVHGVAAVFGRWRELALRVMSRLRVAWLGWLRGLVIAMAIIGTLLWFALGPLIGLPYALSFAVLSGIGEVVPYLGALVTGVPPVAFALTISPGTAVEVLIAYIIVHQIEANIVSPLVMARSVRLHPAVIALGVIAVGEVFGLLGLIIAVPILSAVVILVEEVWVRPQEKRFSRPRRDRVAERGGAATRAARVGISRRG
jgi:predicted PurR-regulated permease PerM